jgi:TetR/AcrR family transcriptional regulator, regulator of biofilm formation and stress response
MSATSTSIRRPTPAAGRRTGRGRNSRGNGRRQLLLETTLSVIETEGVAAVTHRRVAELAGVPLGSTTYWFASRQEMLTEALAHFARLDIETVRRRFAPAGRRPSRRKLVDEFVAYLMPQFGANRSHTAAQYALLQEAAREPALEPAVRAWTEAWQAALTDLFAALGAGRPGLEARMFLAMMDGLSLVQLAAPDEKFEHETLRPALNAWFARVGRGS